MLQAISLFTAAIAAAGYFAVQHAMAPVHAFDMAKTMIQGKVIVITGANSGLGFGTAEFLAQRGAKVVLACRSLSRCEDAKGAIVKAGATVEPDAILLDLGSFKSIRSFVDTFTSKYSEFDVLINNAGVMALPVRTETGDGIEAQMGVNHFGHFLLTALLFPNLKQGGRIVNHSSGAHAFAEANHFVSGEFQTLNYAEGLNSWKAYAKSKQANLQFSYELNDRLAAAGNSKDIKVMAIHPGYTDTGLQGKSTMASVGAEKWANTLFAMKLRDGIVSQVQAAVDPSIASSNNTFYGPKYFSFGFPVVQHTGKYHKAAQEKLWALSEELTGTKFALV